MRTCYSDIDKCGELTQLLIKIAYLGAYPFVIDRLEKTQMFTFWIQYGDNSPSCMGRRWAYGLSEDISWKF